MSMSCPAKQPTYSSAIVARFRWQAVLFGLIPLAVPRADDGDFTLPSCSELCLFFLPCLTLIFLFLPMSTSVRPLLFSEGMTARTSAALCLTIIDLITHNKKVQ